VFDYLGAMALLLVLLLVNFLADALGYFSRKDWNAK